jgi:hypothetical protein
MGLGMAMRTARSVSAGENLLCVPRSLVVDRSAALASLGLDAGSAATLSDESLLALFVLREKARGNDSPWRPYTDTLPMNMGHMPAFWTSEEQRELTRGASPTERNSIIGMDAKRSHEALGAALERSGVAAQFPGMVASTSTGEVSQAFSLHNYQWAHAAVRARMYTAVPGLDHPRDAALVVGIDTSAFSVAGYTSQGQVLLEGALVARGKVADPAAGGDARRADDVCLRTPIPLPPAAGVLATYRHRPNLDLLLRHGIAFHPNEADAVPLHWRAAHSVSLDSLAAVPGTTVLPGRIIRIMASADWSIDRLLAVPRIIAGGSISHECSLARYGGGWGMDVNLFFILCVFFVFFFFDVFSA